MNLKIKKILATTTAIMAMTMPLVSTVGLTASAGQQLGQTTFEDGVGLPWHVCESMTGEMEFEIDNGVYKITIINPGGSSHGGEDRWDCQFRHRGLTIQQGCTYKISFDITASNNCSYYTKIGDMAEPYQEDWHGEPDSSQYDSYWDVKYLQAGQKQTVTGSFTANRTAEVEWAFHIGGDAVPAGTVFTFDNMSLICEGNTTYDYVAEEPYQRADILTNQVGYFKNLNKKATLLTNDNKSQEFYLIDDNNKKVYTGKTTPFGKDNDSGDTVQILDFSDFTEEGTYHIETKSGSKSREFSIGVSNLYSGMIYDGLNYFYQNRSAISIDSKYISSGDSSKLSRPAGHTSDVATIQQTWGYNGSSGTQDVTGGWYDAGDHGKYVVNGGISLWMMQNLFERAKNKGLESVFDDGTMLIPENNNSYPDLLDEARWEMEWMLKMVVKDGEYKGMAYHKVHDIKWTALGMLPTDDELERILKPPTTAATLNLAACAAQASRLWKDYDKSFADECLKVAEEAYEAAKKHPDMYAPLDEKVGGGPYGDTDATDEFYWAASELFITTGEKQYQKDMESSNYYLSIPTSLDGGEAVGAVGSFDWGHTSALGNMSLALNTKVLDNKAVKALTESFEKASLYYADLTDKQGYGLPYGTSQINYADSDEGYIWGSNSVVLDNAIIAAYAYDLTGDEQYINVTSSAMDYILGRNANDYSYVTGYGSHTSNYPHHRFWSGLEFSQYPYAPCGVLVGGPNSGMEDPWVKGSGWKKGQIAPQKCYLDHIEAWSVNECTINWNMPLVWVSAYLCGEEGEIMVGTTGASLGLANVVSANGVNVIEKDDDITRIEEVSKAEEKIEEEKEDATKKTLAEDNDADEEKTEAAEKDKDTNVGLIAIIAGSILAALISGEIFIYKILKLKKDNNNK